MKLFISSFIVLLLSFCTLSCHDDNDERDWSEEKLVEVSSEIVPAYVWGVPDKVEGMLIRTEDDNQWKAVPLFFIEGFEFEPGYTFTLKVNIVHLANPPQDNYNVRYQLISIISQTKVEE